MQDTVDRIAKFGLIAAIWGSTLLCSDGQESSIYRQFFQIPYVYYRLYAGYHDGCVAFLSFRKQWMGIEGAAETSSLSLHTPA